MIKARCKRLEDVDPRWICCARMKLNVLTKAGTIVELEDEVMFLDSLCHFCHQSFPQVPFRRISGKTKIQDAQDENLKRYNVVAIPFMDLDEGGKK